MCCGILGKGHYCKPMTSPKLVANMTAILEIFKKFRFIGEESGQQFIVYVCKNAQLTSNVLNKAFVLQLVRVLGVILS